VIGINAYQKASPLEYACNDAEKVAATIVGEFGFPEENVTVLLDEAATKESILFEYLKFTDDDIGQDDRIVIFFAGHGFTRTGARGEIGFLVPFDGNVADLNSLIRWDDLTRNAELIKAKHVLFVMDACYGGTAVQRYLPPGSMRFARDMIRRFSRQVLTAGKADEVVADAGGPRAGHSVFTGHLLDGLEGAAASTDGLITANGVMSYVYDKVARDYQSNQTPHYGFLDGDGDMILDVSPLDQLDAEAEEDRDILIEIPATTQDQAAGDQPKSLLDLMKEYLSEPRHRILLHDTVGTEVRATLERIGETKFPIQGASATAEEVADRLSRYEDAISDLSSMVVMLARWGDDGHRKSLEHVFARLPDTHSVSGGLTLFLGLRWYPISFLSYAAGIAALANEDFKNLRSILLTPITVDNSHTTTPIIIPTVEGMLDVQRTDLFKQFPGHERHHVPRSEYMFKAVQPHVDDLLFLGRDYERLFDEYELMLALTFADLTFDDRGKAWGPIGRFGWKYTSRSREQNPFEVMVADAARLKDDWKPLQAGFFNGSYSRFEELANSFREMLDNLGFF